MSNGHKNTARVNWRLGEFCTAHGMSKSKFYKEVIAGRLSYFKSGKTTLITVAVADKWQADRLAEAEQSHAA